MQSDTSSLQGVVRPGDVAEKMRKPLPTAREAGFSLDDERHFSYDHSVQTAAESLTATDAQNLKCSADRLMAMEVFGTGAAERVQSMPSLPASSVAFLHGIQNGRNG